MANDPSLTFVPVRVEGVSDVRSLTVYPDRIEFKTASGNTTVNLREIAEWPFPRWCWRTVHRLGWRRWTAIGERDWFHPPDEQFFRFFASPPITVFVPGEPEIPYPETLFRRISETIALGGFGTHDLG